MLSQNHNWQKCRLARYHLPASSSEGSSLPLNKYRHSQETQSTSWPFSDGTYPLNHDPHVETKQNLVTHVTHLLPKSSHSEIISYLLTDWLIKVPKGLGFVSFFFSFSFFFHFNKLSYYKALPDTFLHLYVQTLEAAGSFRERCFISTLPLITRQ